MATRLRRKANGLTPLPTTSPNKQYDGWSIHKPPKHSPRSSGSFVFRICIVLASLLVVTCLAVEVLSGKKIVHPDIVLNNAGQHVMRVGRKMKQSSSSLLKQTPSRSIQYVDLVDSETNTPIKHETYDVIIVGCGPSGLTAALFASRMGMSVLVLGSPSTGSLAGTDTLDNFPSYVSLSGGGRGWLETTIDQAVGFGAKFASPTVLATGLHRSNDELEVSLSVNGSTEAVKLRSRTVIVSSGSVPRKLNLPHESELWGRSLHNCALCDGDAYGPRGSRSSSNGANASNDEKSVVVIGGGDAAVEAVALLARIGVHTIHWIHRREEFRASAAEVEKVRSLPNVQTWTSFVVAEWIVKDGSNSGGTKKTLDGVRIVGSIDGVADPGATSSLTIPCDGAFLMIGSTPNTKWLKTSGMDIDSAGLIRLQRRDATHQNNLPFLSSQTSIPGVFAAGEAVDGIYRQALTAASDGAKGAMDAERYLRFSGTAPIVPVMRERVTEPQKEAAADDEENDHEHGVRINCDLSQSSCITQTVSEHPVVIFGKSFCSYCHRAAEALKAEGVTPLVFQLDYMGKNGRKVQDTLEEMTGRRTVPNVFVGGKTIGGGTETVELHQSGKLRMLLQEAGAI